MKDTEISVGAMTAEQAVKHTAENKNGYVWQPGLYVVIDDQRCVLETREEFDELISELNAAADKLWPATGAWQPIETAPRDGTEVDLWMVDEKGRGERVTNAYWVTDTAVHPYDGRKGKRDGWFALGQDYDGAPGWCDSPEHTDRLGNTSFTKATHWMPTPEPPR